MESFYVVMLVFLALLAAFDLFVGVSDDAVNFLRPAIGSRVAPFKIIMLVASVGVLAGATFSSGMIGNSPQGRLLPPDVPVLGSYDRVLRGHDHGRPAA